MTFSSASHYKIPKKLTIKGNYFVDYHQLIKKIFVETNAETRHRKVNKTSFFSRRSYWWLIIGFMMGRCLARRKATVYFYTTTTARLADDVYWHWISHETDANFVSTWINCQVVKFMPRFIVLTRLCRRD